MSRLMKTTASQKTAFSHYTLQSLAEHPINTTSLEQIGPEAIRRFRAELAEQERRKSERIRERTLQPAEERVQRAMQSIVIEAQRIARNAGQQRQIIRHKHTNEQEEHRPLSINGTKNNAKEFVFIMGFRVYDKMAGRMPRPAPCQPKR
jgi:hypothetical protein